MNKLNQILGKEKVWQNLNEYSRFIHAFESVWTEIFGKLSTEFCFLSFRNKILFIETENPMWGSEIQFYKSMLIQKAVTLVSDQVGKRVVITDIRIKLGKKKSDSCAKPQLSQELKSTTLQESIERLNQKRRSDGWILCEVCRQVYVKEGRCSFCRCEGNNLLN